MSTMVTTSQMPTQKKYNLTFNAKSVPLQSTCIFFILLLLLSLQISLLFVFCVTMITTPRMPLTMPTQKIIQCKNTNCFAVNNTADMILLLGGPVLRHSSSTLQIPMTPHIASITKQNVCIHLHVLPYAYEQYLSRALTRIESCMFFVRWD